MTAIKLFYDYELFSNFYRRKFWLPKYLLLLIYLLLCIL